MRRHGLFIAAISIFTASLSLGISGCGSSGADVEILNVSYDPTRELYRKLNREFVEQYKHDKGVTVRVRQSHGGSGSQARAVLDGIPADVVTLAMWSDTNAIAKKDLIAKNWETQLPDGSLPYSSTIVFVVRKGNPKGIKAWSDLSKPGVQIISSNPKTSGGARLNLLAAWGAVLKERGITDQSSAEERLRAEDEAKKFVTQLYRQCPILDSGARGATITFARRMIGDVHLTWENEAHMEFDELPDDLEVIYPVITRDGKTQTCSIKAEPHVAMVDRNVDRKGTRQVAKDYLEFLHSPKAQDLIAQSHFRPRDPSVLARYSDRLKKIEELFDVTYIDAGGWDVVQKRFFADGGIFDQIYQP